MRRAPRPSNRGTVRGAVRVSGAVPLRAGYRVRGDLPQLETVRTAAFPVWDDERRGSRRPGDTLLTGTERAIAAPFAVQHCVILLS